MVILMKKAWASSIRILSDVLQSSFFSQTQRLSSLGLLLHHKTQPNPNIIKPIRRSPYLLLTPSLKPAQKHTRSAIHLKLKTPSPTITPTRHLLPDFPRFTSTSTPLPL
jgi:hypothetical protein